MALHAKLQLSARRWRAPLWPVVLPLCDWLTGLPPSLGLSLLLLFFSSFYLLLHCTVWHLDQAECHSVPPVSVWHYSSSFSSVSRDVFRLHWGYITFSSPSVCHDMGGRLFYLADFTTWTVKCVFYHVRLPYISSCLCHSFFFYFPVTFLQGISTQIIKVRFFSF